jgi:hypothetical protein
VEYDELHQPQFWNSPFDVKVRNKLTGEAVKNARVAVTGPNQYGWLETDSSGSAQIILNATPDTMYNLTVTADDFIPYVTQFEVEPALNIQLTAENLTVERQRLNKGAETNISVKFKNTGELTASEVELAFYDGEPSEEALIGTTYIFDDLKADSDRQFSFTWTMPGGDHQIYAVLDPENKLMEMNESDNEASISVLENNRPVFFKLPVIPINEDEAAYNALQLSNYVWDPDQTDLLTYGIINDNIKSCKVALNDSSFIDIIPEENWYGQCNITLEVSYGIDTSAGYIIIDVLPVNDPPVLKPLQNQTLLEEQWFEMILFGYDYADADDRIYYETDLFDVFPGLSEGINVEFDRAKGELRLMPTNSMVGEHTIKFKAVDEHGGSSSWEESRFVIVNSPDAPVIKLDEQYSAVVGERFNLVVPVYDEDLNESLLFWDDTGLFEIDPDSGRISFTPESGDEGSHTIKIFVSDGNITVEQIFELTVEGKGIGPVLLYVSIGMIIVAIGLTMGIALITLHKRRLNAQRSSNENDEEALDERVEEDEEDEEEEEKGIEDEEQKKGQKRKRKK